MEGEVHLRVEVVKTFSSALIQKKGSLQGEVYSEPCNKNVPARKEKNS